MNRYLFIAGVLLVVAFVLVFAQKIIPALSVSAIGMIFTEIGRRS